MTARPVPQRHWRCYGDDPLPTGAEALDEPQRCGGGNRKEVELVQQEQMNCL